MQFLDLATTPTVAWKNGGGSTRELACWPPGAGMDSFAWRVSVATIARPGPFSAFPGVDRQIMLLEGDGVQLQAGAGQWQHALTQRWAPFAFSGKEPVDCRMLGGVSTDFNLMLRRGEWAGACRCCAMCRPQRGLPQACAWCCRAPGDARAVIPTRRGCWQRGRACGG